MAGAHIRMTREPPADAVVRGKGPSPKRLEKAEVHAQDLAQVIVPKRVLDSSGRRGRVGGLGGQAPAVGNGHAALGKVQIGPHRGVLEQPVRLAALEVAPAA